MGHWLDGDRVGDAASVDWQAPAATLRLARPNQISETVDAPSQCPISGLGFWGAALRRPEARQGRPPQLQVAMRGLGDTGLEDAMQLPSGTAASERREGSVADVGGLLHSRLSYWMEEGGGDEFQRHGLVEPCLCHPGQRKARARVGLERAQTTGGGGGSGRERWRWEESPRWTGVGVAGGLWRVGPVTAQDRGQSVVARPQFGCRASTLRQSASCIQPNTDAGAGPPETVPLRGSTNLQYYCTSPTTKRAATVQGSPLCGILLGPSPSIESALGGASRTDRPAARVCPVQPGDPGRLHLFPPKAGVGRGNATPCVIGDG